MLRRPSVFSIFGYVAIVFQLPCFCVAAYAAQARSLPHDVVKARLTEPRFERESLQLNIPNGPPLSAKIMVPQPRGFLQAEQRLPALLLFGGFEEASKVLDLLDPSIPVLIATFDYPFAPPRRFEFPESLAYAAEAKRAIHSTLAGMDALVVALKKRPDVDPERITIVGASFGAPFALAAAAEDHDVAGIVLVHGFGDVPKTIETIATRKWSKRLGALARPFAWLLAKGGWMYLDPPSPEDSARKLVGGQHVLMITATADTIIPPASIESLWTALEGSKATRERIDMPGDHLRPGADKLISEIQVLVTKWMEKSKLR